MRALFRPTIEVMRPLLVLTLVLAALAGTAAPRGEAAIAVRTPVDDVGFPFGCDRSYDWEARCYLDTGPRLPVGGVDDKVWRSGLRFSLAGIPRGAVISSARLMLAFEGDYVAPALGITPCPGDVFQLAAYPIASADWYREREPDYYWTVEDVVEVDTSQGPGVLPKLTDASEDFDVGRPYFASMDATAPAVGPRLVIAYTSPAGVAR
jgi:hypothetical protein